MADKKNSPSEIVNVGETLIELEKLLKRLGILYNQYFAGSTRVPPHQLRLQAERLLRDLTTETIRNSTQRHKFHSLSAMYASMQALWGHKLREMENSSRPGRRRGSERVVRFSERRVRTFLASKKTQKTPAAVPEPEAAQPVQAEPPTGAPAASAPSVMDQLYQKIVAFQKSANQPLSFQSADQLGQFLAAQKAKIEQQTGVKGVQLRVVVEGGKLKFKAQLPGAAPSS
jgi:hypothetical protein